MTKFQKLKIIFLFSIFCFMLFYISSVFAAKLFFETEAEKIGINQQFQVDLILDTENEEINAVEGKVLFPEDLLELKEIRDGNSVINFWIERPRLEKDGIIVFSGITPGGLYGEKEFLFSIILQTKAEGNGIIEMRDIRALLNDGQGTPAKTTISNFQFSISKNVSGFEFQVPKDTEPPESFVPEIVRDPNIFENKWFLVFATQDKGSGISHYEILESEQKGSLRGLFKKENWQIGESPYVLKDQNLKSDIYVKAVDKAGNERIATLPAENPLVWYKNYFIWVKIILGVLLAIFIGYILWRMKRKKSFSG